MWRPHPLGREGARARVEEHAVRGGEAARGPRPCWGRGRPGPRPRGAPHEEGPLAGTRAGTPPHAGARRRLADRGGLWRGTSGPDAATAAGTDDRETPRAGKLSSPRLPHALAGAAGMPRSGCGRCHGSSFSSLGPAPAPRAPRAPRPGLPPPGLGAGRRARPARESPQDSAALRPPHPAGALPAPAAPPRSRPAPPMPGMSGAAPGPPRRRHPDSPGPWRSGSHLPACFRQPFPLRAPHPPPPRDRDPERAPRTAAAAGPATPPPPRTRPGPAPRPTHSVHWVV